MEPTPGPVPPGRITCSFRLWPSNSGARQSGVAEYRMELRVLAYAAILNAPHYRLISYSELVEIPFSTKVRARTQGLPASPEKWRSYHRILAEKSLHLGDYVCRNVTGALALDS